MIAGRRPALAAVVLGTAAAMCTTGTVTLRLVADTTASLGLIVAVQFLIAAAFVVPHRGQLTTAAALDRFFATHRAWSLWLLVLAGWCMAVPPVGRSLAPLLVLALVPLIWTVRGIDRFFREVSELPRARAARLTVLHQLVTWGLFGAIFGAAVQLWPRLLA